MMNYGTGAVMSVPGHDQRDFEFARKFGLPVPRVIAPRDAAPEDLTAELSEAFSDYGVLVNSGEWSGKTSDEAKVEMTAFAAAHGFGEGATTYRLRDWGISRQRFWGSPIPMIYCDSCGVVPEKYENLPVELPETAPFTGKGESPLAKVPEFYETKCPNCSEPARRETDTMDTFVDSSWYYFRYLDPQNPDVPFDTEKAAYWTPVDQYIGGDDHAVMHLIYTRFWTKVMKDLGLVSFDEPVKRLLTQGMVVGETFFDDSTGKRIYYPPSQVTAERDAKGKVVAVRSKDGKELKNAIERMSKSKGNGVDPDEMIDIYGADAARLFVLFAAPVDNELVWQEAGIEGAVRFLQRVWRFVWKWQNVLASSPSSRGAGNSSASAGGSDNARNLRMKTHQIIKRVDDSLGSLQFNTPVAALMELSNAIYDVKVEPAEASPDEVEAVREAVTALVLMLTPFAPHTAEELYANIIGNENGILANGARFPEYIEELSKASEIEIPVQVNGKLRSRIFAPPDAGKEALESMALADEKVREYTDGKEIVKVVVVPNRLVSVVVKG
jgi:leucyl-tRNA synthetase